MFALDPFRIIEAFALVASYAVLIVLTIDLEALLMHHFPSHRL